MTLPLPNLDTRRWADLVAEGRSLIPRYAPGWTDHNIHDPGITLMELFAWLTELAIYRTNCIPQNHRRKFLSLLGFPPVPPHPAQVVLAFTLNSPSAATNQLSLPVGLAFGTAVSQRITPNSNASSRLSFRTLAPLQVLPVQITAVQSFDGQQFTDLTQRWQEKLLLLPWGDNPGSTDDLNPDHQRAFYLGLAGTGAQESLPQGELTLWFQFEGPGTDWLERDRILTEAHQTALARARTRRRDPAAGSPGAELPKLPLHHSIRTVWDYFDGQGWQILNATAISDETRGFTLDGPVRIRLPATMTRKAIGKLRCRLVSGYPEQAPKLLRVTPNSVIAQQVSPSRSTLPILPEIALLADQLEIGKTVRLHLKLASQNSNGMPTAVITGLTVNLPGVEAPEVLVIDYQPATATLPGRLTTTLTFVGWGTGLPNQQLNLPGEGAIADGQLQVWTVTEKAMQCWQPRPDLDASHRADAHFCLDASRKVLTFGDGERGRVIPAGAAILAIYDLTAGAAGNLTASNLWQLAGVDDPLNRSLLNGSGSDAVTNTAGSLQILACATARGGNDEEAIDHATGRAVAAFWAHEQLVDLSDRTQCTTLDQIDTAWVLNTPPPQRATTLLDFERLALNVPGTHLRRARAWAGIDPTYPGLKAPGTVTVVIVPELPQKKPCPSSGLLRAVETYLNRRRVIGTRLVVVGPQYVTVSVEAQVQTKAPADPGRVQIGLLEALNRFLDPLQGGANGQGWPFGRDVYRSEILQVIDEVPGVDHVLNLRLLADQGEAQCGNLCVGSVGLVTPGQHHIEVL
jgi:hypothetical protein